MNVEEVRGIIPRAAEDIFNHINTNLDEIDYQISCSMLEIYKETLNDLLATDANAGNDMKIVEQAARGIYVQNLT